MNKNSLKVSSETSLSYWSSLEKFGGTKSQSTQLAHLVNKYHAHVHAKLLQSFLTLWDYSLPDPSVHGILQETVLKWVLCPPPGIFLTQDSNPYLSLFFFLFYFIFKTLHNCISFAKYQNKSPTGIHVFPTMNPPHSSLPIPSLWVVPVH